MLELGLDLSGSIYYCNRMVVKFKATFTLSDYINPKYEEQTGTFKLSVTLTTSSVTNMSVMLPRMETKSKMFQASLK